MDYLKAFLVGGAICMLGQLLIDKTRLTPVSYTHLDVYKRQRLLAGLRFLHHSDKFGSVMLRILGNGFQHFRDKGQYHIFKMCIRDRDKPGRFT